MNKTKIDIISGFLGAGKTTFIKKLMRDLYTEEKVVILENEFGRINIDQETLGREGLIVKPIQAGCICCSSSMDLSRGIHDIILEYHPDRIVVEPTGVAKLSEIKKLLKIDDIDQQCEIEHIVTIVDAKNYYVRTMISKDFFEDQIRSSEVIFLSKTDLMRIKDRNKVIEEIHKINPDCLVIDEVWDNIAPELLKDYMDYKIDSSSQKRKLGMRRNHSNDFDRYEIISEDYLEIERMTCFIKEVEAGEYGEIHRIKGICRDIKKGLYSIDYIPGETIIRPINVEQKENRRSAICLIGRLLNKDKLDEIFK